MAVTSLMVVAEEITRDGARDAAREELSKGMYQAERPTLVERLFERAAELVDEGFRRAGDVVPGGPIGLIILGLLLLAAIVAIRLQTGPLSRSARVSDPFGGFGGALTPGEHRRRADEHEAAGQFAEAIRERLRAIVRDLEERVILEPRLGRTADEVAREAGAVLPDVSADLHRAARTFDDVWYGSRPATAAMASSLREIDQRVAGARPGGARQPAQMAVPQ